MTTPAALTITTPSDLEIQITRVFDAPRGLVFRAYTEPALLRRWLGVFGGWTLAECEVDLRVGGRYRYVWHGPGGAVMGMGGVFREIVPGERIVSTEVFDEAWYEGEGLGTVTFVERDDRTTVTTTMRYVSKDARDGVLRSPMDQGMAASFATLDGVLASLAA